MMAKSSLRSVYDLMAGDRVATVMGYLSDVLAGTLHRIPLRGASRYGIPLRCASRYTT